MHIKYYIFSWQWLLHAVRPSKYRKWLPLVFILVGVVVLIVGVVIGYAAANRYPLENTNICINQKLIMIYY